MTSKECFSETQVRMQAQNKVRNCKYFKGTLSMFLVCSGLIMLLLLSIHLFQISMFYYYLFESDFEIVSICNFLLA